MQQMVIPSKLSEIPAVQDAVLAKVAEHNYDRNADFAIRLALDEALSNAIKHGNGGDASKKVTVEFEATAEQVVITITDEGPGFSPDCLPDPTLEENLTRPHGRGVMLIRAYMSDVQFSECGRRVTMIRRHDCTLPE